MTSATRVLLSNGFCLIWYQNRALHVTPGILRGGRSEEENQGVETEGVEHCPPICELFQGKSHPCSYFQNNSKQYIDIFSGVGSSVSFSLLVCGLDIVMYSKEHNMESEKHISQWTNTGTLSYPRVKVNISCGEVYGRGASTGFFQACRLSLMARKPQTDPNKCLC